MVTTFPIRCALSSAIALFVLGCQVGDEGDDAELLAQSTSASLDAGLVAASSDAAVHTDASDGAAPPEQEPVVRLRGATYIADVTANGTGCPRGTWDVGLAPSGDTLTATFSHYEVTIEDGTRIRFKDCNLSVRMHAPHDVSYAVGAFHAQGYAFLEQGVKGFFTASYAMQGNPIASLDSARRYDLSGPVDRSFLLQDLPTEVDTVWSPCGLDRNLQVVTRLGLQKSQDRGTGYLNLSDIDGEVSGKLVIRIKTRRCGASTAR